MGVWQMDLAPLGLRRGRAGAAGMGGDEQGHMSLRDAEIPWL